MLMAQSLKRALQSTGHDCFCQNPLFLRHFCWNRRFLHGKMSLSVTDVSLSVMVLGWFVTDVNFSMRVLSFSVTDLSLSLTDVSLSVADVS